MVPRVSSPVSPTSPTLSDEDELAKRDRMRAKVIEETVDTERKYLDDISILLDCYVLPLRESELMNATQYADAKVLFSTVEFVKEGNSELLTLLEKQIGGKMMIGEVFQGMADKLCQWYGVFCNHQKKAMDEIDALSKTLPAFRTQLDHCRKLSASRVGNPNGLALLDLLVKPFQRLLKYPLLLSQLQKYTDPNHPDYQHIVAALQALQTEVDAINNNKARSDNMKKLLEINSIIEGIPKGFRMITSNRRFVHEGTVGKISGANDQERHLFLFNDYLLYCKKKGNKYLYRGMISQHRMRLETVPSTDEKFSWIIHRSDLGKSYTFYVDTESEKKNWIKQFENIIDATGSKLKLRSSVDRELVRVYWRKTFKTFAITETQTIGELYRYAIKKITLNTIAEDSLIGGKMLAVNGSNRESVEFDVLTRDVIKKSGQKFNDTTCHFLIMADSVMLNPTQVAKLNNGMPRSIPQVPRSAGASPIGSPQTFASTMALRSPPKRESVLTRAQSNAEITGFNGPSLNANPRALWRRSKSMEDVNVRLFSRCVKANVNASEDDLDDLTAEEDCLKLVDKYLDKLDLNDSTSL